MHVSSIGFSSSFFGFLAYLKSSSYLANFGLQKAQLPPLPGLIRFEHLGVDFYGISVLLKGKHVKDLP